MKIYLIGFMGSGKTYWGKKLSEKLGIPFFDLDEQVTTAEARSINEIFERYGEEYFRLKEKGMLRLLSEDNHSFVMACGGGTPCYFNNIEFMNQAGTTVWINTPIHILFDRLLNEKDKRPLLKELTDQQLMGFITRKFGDRKIYYEQAQIVIDDEEISLDHFIEEIFHA